MVVPNGLAEPVEGSKVKLACGVFTACLEMEGDSANISG